MMYFLARVKFYDEDSKEERFEDLLLSAEDYATAASHIESWYETDLLSIDHFEAMTNNSFLYISPEIADAIKTNSRNSEFW